MKSVWEDITEDGLQWKYLDRVGEKCEYRIWDDGDIEIDSRFDHEYTITSLSELQRVCDLSLEFCMGRKANEHLG